MVPTDDAVKKVVGMAIQAPSQKWTMPLSDWRRAMSRFIIESGVTTGIVKALKFCFLLVSDEYFHGEHA